MSTHADVASSARKLPPGKMGLPFLGETRAWLKNPYDFFETRTRELGPVWKTRILGRNFICLAGPEAFGFAMDETYFERTGASPPHIYELLGGDPVILIDGAKHRRRKQMLMPAFDGDALATYMPTIETMIADSVGRWERMGRFDWLPELQALSFSMADCVFTGTQPNPGQKQLSDDLETFSSGLLSAPIRLPFTRFGRALAARKRLVAYVTAALDDHREHPRDTDVMGRLFLSRDENGQGLSEDEFQTEGLHLYAASAALLTGGLTFLVLGLGEHPEVLERVRAEVASVPRDEPLTVERLLALPYLRQVSLEVRRFYPLQASRFPLRIRRSAQFMGYDLPAGWNALSCIFSTMHAGAVFDDPETFDPERFSPDRHEETRHVHAFATHGGGEAPEAGHRCLAEGMVEVVLAAFMVLAGRDHTWRVLPRDAALDQTKLVPLPKSGVPVEFARASG